MRIIRRILAAWVACTGLTCAPAFADAEWSVLIYMNADNHLEPDALQDFQELATVGSTTSVAIAVQLDRTKNYSDRFGDWTDTMRFAVRRGMQPTPDAAVQRMGEVDMGDGRQLAAFVEWGMRSFPARRYLLVIWGHGKGWRSEEMVAVDAAAARAFVVTQETVHTRFPEPDLATDAYLGGRRAFLGEARLMQESKDPRVEWTPVADEARVAPGVVRYLSTDKDNGSRMYVRDMQESLKRLLGKSRLDVVAFDACLMSMVETAFAMRQIANVMVGSEEEVPGSGFQYQLLLERLNDAPQSAEHEVGSIIVDSYSDTYDRDGKGTLASIDLRNVDSLADRISELASCCSVDIDRERVAIAKARSECERYGQSGSTLHGVDLGRFCDRLQIHASGQKIRNAALAVRQGIASVTYHNYRGGYRRAPYGSTGLAIYFPESLTAYLYDQDKGGYVQANTHYPVEFVEKHSWDEFLFAFWKPK